MRRDFDFNQFLLICYFSGRAAEVSVALTNCGVGKVQHRLTASNNNKSTTSSTAGTTSTGVLASTLSPSIIPSGPLLSSAGHPHDNISSMNTSPSTLKDDMNDSYVIQVKKRKIYYFNSWSKVSANFCSIFRIMRWLNFLPSPLAATQFQSRRLWSTITNYGVTRLSCSRLANPLRGLIHIESNSLLYRLLVHSNRQTGDY